MLRRMKIGTRVNLLIAVPLLALLALTWVSYASLQRASVRGDSYKELKTAESLRSNIVPPKANLLRAWTAVNHLSVLASSPVSDRTNLEIIDALTDLKTARSDYTSSVVYWRSQPLDKVTKTAFEKSAKAGDAFFAKVDSQLTPALDAHQPAEVIAAVHSLGDDYAVQQSTIYRLIDLVETRISTKEASTDNFVGTINLLLAGAVGMLLMIMLVTAFMVRRSIVNPILALSSQARKVADTDLPIAVHQMQTMAADAPPPKFEPFMTGTHDELADLSASFNSVQNAALDLAAEQALDRRVVSDNLVNIARRTQLLLGRSLTSLSDMEQTERDPQTLENLFHLDHLSTRMRRNAQSLLVLAGAEQNRLWSMPLPIGDVVRAAISEIENYSRVELGDLGVAAVQGALAPDIAHLLAELLENATSFSPPSSKVMVVGRSFPDGHQIAIIDYGIGLPDAELQEANTALRRHVDFAQSSSKMIGFQVVARIANRHSIEVVLAQTAGATGVTAIIKLPPTVLEFRQGETAESAEMAERAGTEVPDTELTDTDLRLLGIPPTALVDGLAEPVQAAAELAMVGSGSPVAAVPVEATRPIQATLPFQPGQIFQPAQNGQNGYAPQNAKAQTGQAALAARPTLTVNLPRPVSPPHPSPQPMQLPPPSHADQCVYPDSAADVPGLPKRVRGAQMPDLGLDSDLEPIFDRPAEQVRTTLSSLQRGTELGRRHSDD
jgi:HAMP domain